MAHRDSIPGQVRQSDGAGVLRWLTSPSLSNDDEGQDENHSAKQPSSQLGTRHRAAAHSLCLSSPAIYSAHHKALHHVGVLP